MDNTSEGDHSYTSIPASPTSNRHSPALLPLLTLTLLVALTGCTPLGSSTRPRTAPTATTTPPPPQATVTVTAVEQGSIAAKNAELLATATITNHTDAPIFITSIDCPHPTLQLELRDASGATLWHNEDAYMTCPLPAAYPSDTWIVAANASLDRQMTATFFTSLPSSRWISPASPASLRAGDPYTVVATVRQWHQGKLSDIGNPAVPQGTNVTGEVLITFP